MITDISDLADLKRAYYALISEYILMLRIWANSSSKGWVTKQMLEDHIRIILREIIKAFTLYEHASFNNTTTEDLSWFRQEREYLTGLADQLPDFRQQLLKYAWRILTLLWASALLDFAAATKEPDQTGDVSFILSNALGIIQTLALKYALPLFFLGIVLLLAMWGFFGLKRSYFKSDYDLYDNRSMPISETRSGVNIYRLENDLFRRLERKKPREIAWDAWAAFLLGGSAGAFMWASLSPAPPGYPAWLPVFLAIFIMLSISGGVLRGVHDHEK
jgi:hypothetical protein